MSAFDALHRLFEHAGVFAIPLVALAFSVFCLATWAGLRVRDIEGGAAGLDRIVSDVTRVLRLLAVTASAAPLVGLLGTVHGLIALFANLEAVGVFDRNTLTSGVGQALFTTEFGLAIAVPGIVLHAAIRRALRTRSDATSGARLHRRRRRFG